MRGWGVVWGDDPSSQLFVFGYKIELICFDDELFGVE